MFINITPTLLEGKKIVIKIKGNYRSHSQGRDVQSRKLM